MKVNTCIAFAISTFLFSTTFNAVHAWTPLAVKDDPLVRMPGTQPEQGVQIEDREDALTAMQIIIRRLNPVLTGRTILEEVHTRIPVPFVKWESGAGIRKV